MNTTRNAIDVIKAIMHQYPKGETCLQDRNIISIGARTVHKGVMDV
jgi:hypothetical protein